MFLTTDPGSSRSGGAAEGRLLNFWSRAEVPCAVRQSASLGRNTHLKRQPAPHVRVASAALLSWLSSLPSSFRPLAQCGISLPFQPREFPYPLGQPQLQIIKTPGSITGECRAVCPSLWLCPVLLSPCPQAGGRVAAPRPLEPAGVQKIIHLPVRCSSQKASAGPLLTSHWTELGHMTTLWSSPITGKDGSRFTPELGQGHRQKDEQQGVRGEQRLGTHRGLGSAGSQGGRGPGVEASGQWPPGSTLLLPWQHWCLL